MGWLLDLNTVNTGLIAPPNAILGVGLLLIVAAIVIALTAPDPILVVGGGGYRRDPMQQMADTIWYNTYILQPAQQRELLKRLDEKK